MSHAFQTGFIMGAAFCIPAAVIAYAVGYDHAMKVAKKLRQISFDRELKLHRVAARSGKLLDSWLANPDPNDERAWAELKPELEDITMRLPEPEE